MSDTLDPFEPVIIRDNYLRMFIEFAELAIDPCPQHDVNIEIESDDGYERLLDLEGPWVRAALQAGVPWNVAEKRYREFVKGVWIIRDNTLKAIEALHRVVMQKGARTPLESRDFIEELMDDVEKHDLPATADLISVARVIASKLQIVSAVRFGEPSNSDQVPEPRKGRNVNDSRDKFIYESIRKGKMTLGEIRLKVNKRPGWIHLGSDQAVSQAAKRYASRHGNPWPV